MKLVILGLLKVEFIFVQFISNLFIFNKYKTKLNIMDRHDLSYYSKCMMGGALACGLTHLLIVPLDVMKCRKQIDINYCSGMFDGVRKVSAAGQLTLGWVPTLFGYSIQGSGKFGFYEIFKDVFKNIVG